MNHGKRYDNNFKTIDRNLEYSLDDAVKIIKEICQSLLIILKV